MRWIVPSCTNLTVFELGVITVTIDNNNSIHMKGKVSEIKEIDIKI